MPGVPNPYWATDQDHLWPVRNQAAQQEVNGGQGTEVSSVPAAAPQHENRHLRSSGTRFS